MEERVNSISSRLLHARSTAARLQSPSVDSDEVTARGSSKGGRLTRSVRSGLVPSLGSSSERAEEDGEVQRLGVRPLVLVLVGDCLPIGLIELGDSVVVVRVLGEEGSLAEDGDVLGQALLLGEPGG